MLPPALTILGVFLIWWGFQGADAPIDARHWGCILQAYPLYLCLLAHTRQDSHLLHREKCQHQHPEGRGALGTGMSPYQRRGAAWGGELGHQEIPVNGEDRPAPLGCIWGGQRGSELQANLSQPWHHGTHQLSVRLCCLFACPPQTHPEDRRAESSSAPEQLLCVPPGPAVLTC